MTLKPQANTPNCGAEDTIGCVCGYCVKPQANKTIGGAMSKPFTVEELQVWSYRDDYFVEVLNGEKSLEEAIEDLSSFRNTSRYRGSDAELAVIKEEL